MAVPRPAAATINVLSAPAVSAAPNAPLARLLTLSTNVPTTVSFKVEGNNEAWWVDSSDLSTNHSIPVLGLAPDSNYTVKNIRLSTMAGGVQTTLGDQFAVTTSALPATLPGFHVEVSNPSQMEPGYTLFGVNTGYTVALDAEGTVRWLVEKEYPDIRQEDNGLFIGRPGQGIEEIDILGNVIRSWYPSVNPGAALPGGSPVAAPNPFHHDVYPMKNGDFVTLSTTTREVANYPTSYTDPTPRTATIVSDVVVEFAPDGTVVHSWDLADILDPTRVGYDSINTRGESDWAHANAVYHDEEDPNDPLDDTFVVSLRHQDAVVKFSRETGQLKWILGNHDNWSDAFQPYLLTPVGDPNSFEWQYHQHSAKELADGSVLLFDNGNNRASPFTGQDRLSGTETYSRGVLYDIDEDQMTVEQVWEYGSPASSDETIFSPVRGGDADFLSQTGNRLITFGAPTVIGNVRQSAIRARIVEVDEDGNQVFRLDVGDPGAFALVYRSERIASLYPAGYTVRSVPSPSSALLAAVAVMAFASSRRRVADRSVC